MTYLVFHFIFILPPLIILSVLTYLKYRKGLLPGRSLRAITLTAIIAVLYTTPWDNYLVYRGVWEYGPERVVGTIGYVPIEEYLFFVLQTYVTGLLLVLSVNFNGAGAKVKPGSPRRYGTIIFGLIAGIGFYALLSPSDRDLYLGLILGWAGPVLAAMWGYAGNTFLRHWKAYSTCIAVPTLYLWVADGIAIGNRIWNISEEYTIGFSLFGLPLEEALFFLFTNILVVQGTLLFLFGKSLTTKKIYAQTVER